MKATFHWATFVIAVLSAPASQAVPVATDSFATSAGGNDYVPFTSILGQSPTVGATGFVGAWGNCCTSSMVPVPGGLTHDLTPGETFDGHLIAYTIDGSVGGGNARNLSRTIDYTPSDGTYYMSVLLRKYAATTRGDLLAGLGRSQNPETSIYGIEGTWIGFVDGGIYFVSGPGPNLTPLLSAAAMNVDETYFALMQYDFTTSGSDTVTATIFNGSSVEVASQAFPGLNLDQTMGRFSVFTQDFGPIPELDEWRFGTQLSDVMVPEPFAGDYNGNGVVDAADYVVWRKLLGQAVAMPNETVTPGMVTPEDYNEWKANFGNTAGSGSSSNAAVPEPAGAPLVLVAVGIVCLWRRPLRLRFTNTH